MKKGILVAIILAIVTYLVITQGTKLISNKLGENEVPALDFSNSTGAVTEENGTKKEERDISAIAENVDVKDEKETKEVLKNDSSQENKQLENSTKTKVENKNTKDSKEENIAENKNSVEEKEHTENKQKENQNNDEFYDTSDRDPFAEKQHKSDVPLVLVDDKGNEMQPETVYWDEERGQGTLDPSGYIPEGLPPGAVFVSEITPEEEARLREEFNVE